MPEFSRNLAFIVGINQYGHGISPLYNAVSDAKQITEVLREKHGYQTWVCLDEVATLNNLNQLLNITLPQNVTQDDRLLFYFAGHGIALNDDDDPAGYLIPQDAKQGNVQTYLSMTRLQAALEKLPCRHFLGILDCCFAGAFRWGSTRDLLASPEVIHRERYDRFIQDPAWQMITSAASDQKAFDAFDLKTERGRGGEHSPFAVALIEALSGDADRYPPAAPGKQAGDGIVTATELYLYLRDRVEVATESRRQRQTPGIWSLKKHDKGEYIFLTPGHQLNLPPALPLDESKNPYRGLESFEAKHKDLFFGRGAIVEQLQEFVVNQPLAVVIGASGSGKSSLVKAGLIPKLQKISDPEWITVVIRPGKSVFAALNLALDREITSLESYKSLISDWSKTNPDAKLLLVIDQCEELITLSDEQESHRFLSELASLLTTHSDILRVVLTLRSDFEPQLRDLALKDRWQTARFIVSAMSRSQLRDAVEKPAEARVMYFEPHGLVDQLIDEVADMPGALPLLSFALSELYLNYLRRQREASHRGKTLDRAITQTDYDYVGGVTRSLTQRADQECAALGKDYEQMIQTVMLRMVAIGSGELARRRVFWSELTYSPAKAEQVKAVITRFSAARLLVEGQDAEGNRYVEPAHDALIQGWVKLRDWVKAEKNLDLQRRLTPAAFEWKTEQQKRFLWNADPYLDVLHKEVFNSPDRNWLNQVETEFVQRSIQQKRRNGQTRWGIAIAVMLGLSGLAIAAEIGQINARIGRMLSDSQSSEATLQSGQLTLDALRNSLRAGKSLQGLAQQLAFKPNSEQQDQVIRNLRKAIYTVKESNRFEGFSGDVKQLFWYKDQLLIVTSERQGTIRVLNRQAQRLAELPQADDSVREIKFSPDGRTLAIALKDGKVQLWNWETQQVNEQQAHKPSADQTTVNHIQFSPDGSQLAISGSDNTAYLWTFSSNSIQGFKQPKNSILVGAGFDDKGQFIRIITLGDRKTISLLDSNSKKQREFRIVIPDFPAGTVDSAVFSPNGKQVVIYAESAERAGQSVILWTLESNRSRFLQDATIALSNNGTLATTGLNDSTVLVDKPKSQDIELKGHRSQVVSLGFRSDSSQLATASTDGTVRIWSMESEPFKLIKQLEGSVHTVTFESRKRQLITQTTDGILHWFDFSGNVVSSSQTPTKLFNSLAIRPDGQGMIAIAEDRTLQSFDPSGKLLTVFDGTYQTGNISFRADSKAFAVVASDPEQSSDRSSGSQIVQLETTSGKPLQVFKLDNDISVSKVIWRPQKNQLLYATIGDVKGTTDRSVRLWDAVSNRQYAIPLTSNLKEFTSTNFNRDGSVFVAGDRNGLVDLTYLEGIQMAEFQAHDDEVANVSLSPDSSMLVTVGKNGTAKLWQIGGLDELMARGCDRIRAYLQNPNAELSQEDRQLCDRS